MPTLLQTSLSSPALQRSTPPIPRKKLRRAILNCSNERPILRKDIITRHLVSGLAASCIFLSNSQTDLVYAQVPPANPNNLCQLAAISNNSPPSLPLEKTPEEMDGGRMMLMMKRGMTAQNFDPVRYVGRWFEVASLKRGFAGQGQEDCHCTQGLYTFNMEKPSIQVDTFCVHGGPDGYITGIRGNVQCLPEEETERKETDLERLEMIKEKCYLRFPTLPFIPKEPYDVLATDYDNFALVSGAKDRSFIQIYSRTPNPGPDFIGKYRSYLLDFGYDANRIKDTPQDCQVMSNSQLTAMMSATGMQQALNNRFPDLELNASVEFDPLTSVFDTFKKLVQLYFK